jgi:hypothetical protein
MHEVDTPALDFIHQIKRGRVTSTDSFSFPRKHCCSFCSRRLIDRSIPSNTTRALLRSKREPASCWAIDAAGAGADNKEKCAKSFQSNDERLMLDMFSSFTDLN